MAVRGYAGYRNKERKYLYDSQRPFLSLVFRMRLERGGKLSGGHGRQKQVRQ